METGIEKSDAVEEYNLNDIDHPTQQIKKQWNLIRFALLWLAEREKGFVGMFLKINPRGISLLRVNAFMK
jgi:hypothetical protein